MNRQPTQWNDERIAKELREITGSIGSFPTVSELRRIGRNDLTCAIGRTGGLIAWAERLGLSRKHSDSDTGWAGEVEFQKLVQARGIKCERMAGVKAPFDLMIEDAVRVDVKSARFTGYPGTANMCRGWFYRLGKIPQADLIVLYQLDTQNFHVLPWWSCSHSNITITKTGKRYEQFLNNWPLLLEMVEQRKAEQSRHSALRVAGDEAA